MMKWLFAIFFTTTLLSVNAQKDIDLRKKFLGIYKGTVPSYKINSRVGIIEVSETPIRVTIEKDQVQIKIGENIVQGTYDVMFKAKKYFLLDIKINGQLANEKIMVYKAGSHISRDGLYPQPVCELEKVK